MSIEKFTANTLEECIEQISAKWGSEAIILHVERQKVRAGFLKPAKQRVEVTARAPEQAVSNAVLFTPAPEANPAQGDTAVPRAHEVYAPRKPLISSSVEGEGVAPTEAQWGEGPFGREMMQHMVDRGINEEDARQLVGDWNGKQPKWEQPMCLADLDRRIPRLGWREIFPLDKGRCTLFVGLPGAGKTLLLIKMAARLKLMHKSKVLILSADVSRAGPSQELALYSEILDVPVVQVFDLADVKSAIQDADTETQILVDWNGISPYDDGMWQKLREFKQSHPAPQIILTVSLVSDLQLWKRVQHQFSGLPLAGLALTQADLEYRMGKIWEGVRGTNLPLAFISTGKNVPGDVCEGTSFPFARLLFKDFQPVLPKAAHLEVRV